MVKASYMKLPLSFIKNEGQKERSVLFYEQGAGHATTFTKDGISLSLARSGKVSEVVTLTPRNASLSTTEALDPRDGKVNYIIGKDSAKWKTNISTYGAVLYKNVYPGIDMKFYGTNKQLEYDLIVSPGVDPSKIRLSYKGIEKLSLAPSGDLEIALKAGSIFQKKPHIYQTINDRKIEIEGKFILADATTYGFAVGAYDKAQPLVIDPTLVFSTYLGGNGDDHANAIAVDSSGKIYVAGYTDSTDFPVKGAYQATLAGVQNAFVTKITGSGSLVYSTYLGGSEYDRANGIAVDSSGNVYITGNTSSTDFPVKNAYQATLAGEGNGNAFIAKLDPSGSGLIFSTYLGGTGGDFGIAITIDSSGSAYIAGTTRSPDFPVKNAYQATLAGFENVFVTKLASAGSSLTYSTYLGGTGGDRATGIAVDSSGNSYVTGYTSSPDFPVKNAYQATLAGEAVCNAFIIKLDPSGSGLIFSTYLGGSGYDTASGIAVDTLGNAYVAGATTSTDFPVKNAYQGTLTGDMGAFITKIDPSGSSLMYSTYLGGTSGDSASAIAVDSSGNAYVAGIAQSTDFPVKNAYQGTFGGGTMDAFITKLDSSGSNLTYSTYIGGTSDEGATAIAVDVSGNVYVAGWTGSSDFPIKNAYQGTFGGGDYNDAFIAKFIGSMPNIYWRNTSTGQNVVWYMNGASRKSYAYLPTLADQNWKMIGIGDFDNDGATDIVWRNTSTGQNVVWYMNGASRKSYAYLPTLADQNWKMIGIGDFDSDGATDIVWRNTSTGQNVVWYMNGASRKSYAYLPTLADQNWKMIGIGDFDNDGATDIVWRNTSTGQNVVWYMNGASRKSYAYLPTLADQNWKMIGIGDFDSDGATDIVWRNTSTGQNVVWYMNGASRKSYAYLPTLADQNWKMIGGQSNY